jgi:hypothetical protein
MIFNPWKRDTTIMAIHAMAWDACVSKHAKSWNACDPNHFYGDFMGTRTYMNEFGEWTVQALFMTEWGAVWLSWTNNLYREMHANKVWIGDNLSIARVLGMRGHVYKIRVKD